MRLFILASLASALLCTACGTDGDGGRAGASLTLGVSGLDDLGADYVYEGWLIVDGSPISAGRFSVDAEGNATPDRFTIDPEVAAAATTYVLTLEPAVGDDPAPSDVHVLAGDFVGATASLATAHAAALGTDFATAAGEYILETPTTMAVAEDYAQGIWYLVPGDAGMSAGLVLPALPAGWTYEGWVVGADGPVSTGTFTAAAQSDSDQAGATAGPDGSPAFPGQDFIDPARVLTDGHAAVISVEPVPDNSAMPFAIKPLADMDIEAVMAPATQALANIAADTLPSGSVTLIGE